MGALGNSVSDLRFGASNIDQITASGNWVVPAGWNAVDLFLGNGGGGGGGVEAPRGTLYSVGGDSFSTTSPAPWDVTGGKAIKLAGDSVLVLPDPASTAHADDVTPYVYAAVGDTWTATGAMVTPRVGFGACLLADGKVLVAGGVNAAGTILDSCEIYDPVANTWATTDTLSSARYFSTLILLNSGAVLAIGGDTGSMVTTCEIWTAGTWAPTGSLAVARRALPAVKLATGDVLIAGAGSGGDTNASYIYSVGGGTWSATGNLNASAYAGALVLLPDNTVMFAGQGNSGGNLSAEVYTPGGGTWAVKAGYPIQEGLNRGASHGKATVNSGDAFVVLGPSGARKLYRYTPGSSTWTDEGEVTRDDSISSLNLGGWLVAFSTNVLFTPSGIAAGAATGVAGGVTKFGGIGGGGGGAPGVDNSALTVAGGTAHTFAVAASAGASGGSKTLPGSDSNFATGGAVNPTANHYGGGGGASYGAGGAAAVGVGDGSAAPANSGGGGGGGCGAESEAIRDWAASGGGGGAFAYIPFVPVTPGDTVAVIIGAGGAGGTGDLANGGAGGDGLIIVRRVA